jgi:hypothetical protein
MICKEEGKKCCKSGNLVLTPIFSDIQINGNRNAYDAFYGPEGYNLPAGRRRQSSGNQILTDS